MQPTTAASHVATSTLIEERDALRDEVEGLKAGVETVMRALKIALKEHNEARVREAVLIDLLRQSEAECNDARALLTRCQAALPPNGRETTALLQEIEASLLLGETSEEDEGDDASV